MIKFITIATEDECYALTATIENNEYVDTCLEFKLDGDIIAIWDNNYFLHHYVYPYLKDEDIDDEKIYDNLEETFSNVKEDVKEIFDEAKAIGML